MPRRSATMATVTVRLPVATVERLDHLCADVGRGLTRAEAIRILLERGLDRLDQAWTILEAGGRLDDRR